MNPDIANIDTSNLDTNTFMGMSLSPSHLLWTTIVTLVVSHFGAQYLVGITPRGYLFWFTILNLIIGFLLM